MSSKYLDEDRQARRSRYEYVFEDRLDGRNVLVAGGAGGLGAAICARLMKTGASVVLGYAHDSERAAAVKADAYGVGAERVAPVLARAGCDTFFVATLDEALSLRELMPGPTIAVLNGAPVAGEADFLAHDLTPVLNDLGQIKRWAALARDHGRLDAMIHLDTGMCRLGLPAYEVERLAAEPERLDGLDLTLVMSHLACAEETEHPMNDEQRIEFDRLRQILPSAPASTSTSKDIC